MCFLSTVRCRCAFALSRPVRRALFSGSRQVLAWLALAAVMGAPVASWAQDEADPAAASVPIPAPNYVLRPGDVIHVQVFQEPDLDRELRIAQDDTIVLPLIGAVKAGRRTISQVQEDIAKRYDADYLVNPHITVTVLRYAERRVNIMGMVNQPGTIVFPPEETMALLDAITRAGGFNRFADRRRVRLTRTDAEGRVQQFSINTDDILQGNSTNVWLLEPGDNIFVPERLL